MEKPNLTFAKIPILDTASGTGSASEGFAKKKGRTVAVITEDMQKRRNDVKARTTLLLALPDEHQLRFSNYKTAQELWAAILKTFGGNEATKKTKKNQLKQDGHQVEYGSTEYDGYQILEKDWEKDYYTRAPMSQDRGRRENFKQGSKTEESALKVLMAIDGVGWDWSYMPNEEENQALVADEEAPTEFVLMAKSSSSSENEVDFVAELGREQEPCENLGRWRQHKRGLKGEASPVIVSIGMKIGIRALLGWRRVAEAIGREGEKT
nr:hypothetical protein [Tanacetum cinerariifolium]